MSLATDGLIYLTFFTALAAIVTMAVWRYVDPAIRIPYGLYCGFYIVTSGIGGAIAGLTEGAILETLDWGLDLSILQGINTLTYWGILYAPLIVPGISLVLMQDFRLGEYGIEKFLSGYRDRLDCLTLLGVYSVFAAYCFVKLAVQGQLGSIMMWFTLKSDFLSIIILRETLMLSLGSVFFGLVYITLPMLSFCALYRIIETRKVAWVVTFGIMVCSNVVLSMALMQKSPVILYLVFVGVACVELGLIRWQALGGLAALLVMFLTTLQSFMLQDWDYSRSFSLMTFRMAQTFPYYISVYPEILEFAGIDFGQHFIGMGEVARDNLDVFNYMYPDITWVQGAAPGPAHLRAYSQGGVLFSIFTLILIGMSMKLIIAIRRTMNGPASFALYIECLVFLYYLTQTSLRESILSCYGIFWGIVGIIPLILFNRSPGSAFQPLNRSSRQTQPHATRTGRYGSLARNP